MAHIDYYFSTLSPYVYFAGNRLEEIAAKHGKKVNYKPLDLPTLFLRTGGQLPKDRHPNRMSYRAQELPRQAKKAGLTLNMTPAFWPMNAAPSCYAIIAASRHGNGDMGKFIHALGRCIWAEDKDVSQDEVVRACLVEAGFDALVADKDMLSSAETYAANLEDAMNAGAFGAPFYVTDDDQRFWGQDRLDDLDAYLSGDL